MPPNDHTPFLTRVVETFLRGDAAVLLIGVSLALGLAAIILTPREEEPQIVVPLADVLIAAPGLSSEEVEKQVTVHLEKLLYQIDGVEYVYSMSRAGEAVVTVRFYVGQDREDSLVKLYNMIHSHQDQIPASVTGWVVKPVEVDDVPIVNVTLWSDATELYGDYQLRRIAEELQNDLRVIPDTNRVWVIGGRPRKVRVELDPVRLAAHQTSALQVAHALPVNNTNVHAGWFNQQDMQTMVEAGTFVRDAVELKNLVINVSGGRPVYLKDVAEVIDGPDEVDSYTWMGFGPAAQNPYASKDSAVVGIGDSAERRVKTGELFPAVHIAVAKRKGSNAVRVAQAVDQRMSDLSKTLLPKGVYYRITRDYGETADAKVNELIKSLIIAVVTVIGLIGLVIGWRAALVVALAVPVCYSITLFVNLLLGYTINRVTLFALILALGLLVDDPITGVENIARFLGMRRYRPREAVLRAVQEVQPALILSTLAIIASFVPLMFITGMMGPYMAPMAVNVPLTVTISTLVAVMITPFVSLIALRSTAEATTEAPEYNPTTTPLYRLSQWTLGTILDRRWLAWSTLGAVALLLFATMALPALRVVPLKMLPYDNKNEFQIVVDMPEGSTLEQTETAAGRLASYLSGVAEVRDYQIYVGLASPMDFNGMVRHYFLRRGANVADIRVNLAPKEKRSQQSHTILLRIRDDLEAIAEAQNAKVKLVEVPPGPPVIATVTAEVYGPRDGGYDELIAAAIRVEERLRREPRIVDVDISAEDDSVRTVFQTDQAKAALSGVTKENIARTIQIALSGIPATVMQLPGEVNPLEVRLQVPRDQRSSIADIESMYVQGEQGQIVQIGALGQFVDTRPDGSPLQNDKTIFRKNLRRVAYVFGEVAGRPPADAILDIELDRQPDGTGTVPAEEIRDPDSRTWLSPGGNDPWSLPEGYEVRWAGEGEWKITLDVFRDMGLAFAAAMVGIFIILMFQTRSQMLPMMIMLAIPLTLIGIMPGFWLLNVAVDRPVGGSGYPNPVFFTATAMIGMIALGGIVVRNSVVLIDFIHQGQSDGLSVREAVIQSVAVRTRPILLTAGTTLLGNWVITLDPIFSGLAWSIIFGILTSTLFTLLVIPVVYWLLYENRPTEDAV